MPDGLDQYLDQFKKKKRPTGDDSVARVLDDEFTRLGYNDTARLSILGDVGRESGWDRKTIFGGHNDPKNNARNRGIISWQGDRRSKLDDHLKKEGVLGRGDDDELRGMARFMDKEMREGFPDVYKTVKNARGTYEASEALRKYIRYVPDAPYNSPDDEFRVKNNATWAKRAKALGLGQKGLNNYLDNVAKQQGGDPLDAYLEDIKGSNSPGPTFNGKSPNLAPEIPEDDGEVIKVDSLPANMNVGSVTGAPVPAPPGSDIQPQIGKLRRRGQKATAQPDNQPVEAPVQAQRPATQVVRTDQPAATTAQPVQPSSQPAQQQQARPWDPATPEEDTIERNRGTFVAEVDPDSTPDATDKNEAVFRQAIRQWGQAGRQEGLNKMQEDALVEYQRSKKGGFVFTDETNEPTEGRKGPYTITDEDTADFDRYLQYHEADFRAARADNLREFLAAGGDLNNDARSRFKELGMRDDDIDQLIGFNSFTGVYSPSPFMEDVEGRKREYQKLVDTYSKAPDEDTRMNALTYARRAMGWITPGQAADELADFYKLRDQKQKELGQVSITDPFEGGKGRSSAMAGGLEPRSPDSQNRELQNYLIQTIGKYGTATNKFAVDRQEALAEAARKNRIAQMSWPEYIGRTAVDSTLNIAKSAVSVAISGTLRGIALTAKQLDTLTGNRDFITGERRPDKVSDYATYKAADSIDGFLDFIIPTNKDMQGEFLAGKLPQGLGSTLGMAVGGVSKTPRVAIAVLSSLQMGGDAYKEAIQGGASEAQAQTYGLLSAPLGITEIFGIGEAINRLNKGTGGSVWKTLFREAYNAGRREAPEELLQEGTQTVSQNVIARLTYDPDRKADKDLYENLLVAGISAPLASAGVSVLNVARNRHAIKQMIEQEQANGVIIKSFGDGELYVFDQKVPVTPELAPMVERYNFSRNGIMAVQAEIKAVQEVGKHAQTPEQTAPYLQKIWELKKELTALQTRQVQISKDIADAAGVPPPEGTVGDTLIPPVDEAAGLTPNPEMPGIQEVGADVPADANQTQEYNFGDIGTIPVGQVNIDPAVPPTQALTEAQPNEKNTEIPSQPAPVQTNENVPDAENVSPAAAPRVKSARKLPNTRTTNHAKFRPGQAVDDYGLTYEDGTYEEVTAPSREKAIELGDLNKVSAPSTDNTEPNGEPAATIPVTPETPAAQNNAVAPKDRGPIKVQGIALTDKTDKPKPLSNTQIEFSPEQAKPFEKFRTNVINPKDVADKAVLPGYAKDGIHDIEPHVTVKYGLHTNNHEDVIPSLAGEKPIEVELGKTSVFKGSEKTIPGTDQPVPYDVVTVAVKSADLERLNKKLTAGSENTTTFPYSPHVTLAYVKSGAGEKYAGRTDFEGQKYTFDGVTFSPADKSGKKVIPLGIAEKPASNEIQKEATPVTTYRDTNVADARQSQQFQDIARNEGMDALEKHVATFPKGDDAELYLRDVKRLVENGMLKPKETNSLKALYDEALDKLHQLGDQYRDNPKDKKIEKAYNDQKTHFNEIADQYLGVEKEKAQTEKVSSGNAAIDEIADVSPDISKIVNPIPLTGTQEQKVAAMKVLADQNVPIVERLIERIKNETKAFSAKWSHKAPENIIAKANRPSIKKEKPWFNVEHIRDSLRFSADLNTFDDLIDIAKIFKSEGIEVFELDTDKMIHPREWGWRMAALDLRMPNGQFVEFYTLPQELNAPDVKKPNHALFENWREQPDAEIEADHQNYLKDIAESRDRYDAAWERFKDRMGYKDEAAAAAAWTKVSNSLESVTGKKSSLSSSGATMPLDQTPSSRTIANGTGSESEVGPRNTLPESGLTDATIIKSPAEDNITQNGESENKPDEKPKSTSDLFREKLAKLKAEQDNAATEDDDDGWGDLDSALGLRSVIPFEEEQPFFASKYNTYKPIFEKIVSKFDAKTPDEQMETFLRKMNERYPLDVIAQLEPYVVKFFDENLLQSGENGSIDKVEAQNDADTTKSDRNGQNSNGDQSSGDVQGTEQSGDSETSLPGEGGSGTGNNVGTEESGDNGNGSKDGESSVSGEGSESDGTRKTSEGNSDSASDGVPERGKRNDYVAPNGSLTREGSWRTAASNNLDAIELVKKIEAEKRLATPEEQAILAKFVGWGASEIRNHIFKDPDGRMIDAAWKDLAKRLREVMTPEEITTAERSTQYAHYTSEKIIRGIWSALDQFGFTHGSIMEPGMGIGLFAVAAPKTTMDKSSYTGIEMDSMSARIAKLLLPDQAALQNDFIKQKLPKNHFDVAIGNPPFAGTKIYADREYRKYKFLLHDYFFAKSIDSVRPGGLMVFVTSKGTMDKLNDSARQYMAERADLLGAIRLPQTAFKQNAGTDVVTDVLFFRKRMAGEEPAGEAWMGHGEVTAQNKYGQDATGLINEYYINHPEMVLGEHSFAGEMRHGDNEYTVKPNEGDIEEQFQNAVKNLPKAVFAKQGKTQEIVQATAERDWNPATKKEGSLYIHDDGRLMIREGGSGVAVAAIKQLSAKDEKWLKDYIGLRTALKQAQYDQLNAEKEGTDWEKSLAELNKVYDAFVKKNGHILAFTDRERTKTDADGNQVTTVSRSYKNEKLIGNDIEAPLVWSLEKISDDGEIGKSSFLKQRTIKPPDAPKIETLQDALMVSLDQVGRLNIGHIADLIKPVKEMSEAEIIADLGDLIYEDPAGGWVMADEYLSGNVKDKLEVAQAAASDPRFKRNVEALEKVQPLPLPAEKITVQIGATWVPQEVVAKFAEEELGIKPKRQNSWPYTAEPAVTFDAITNKWTVPSASGKGSQSKRDAAKEWGTEHRSPDEILEAALNSESVTIMATEAGPPRRTYVDKDAVAAVRAVIEKMNQAFKPWLFSDPTRAKEMVDLYNRKMNVMAEREFDGRHLTTPGLSAKYKLYDHQKRAVWRVVQTGNTYLAHAVGAGKTLEMIVSAMEQKRLGLINKPMFIVPNHMLKQFASEFIDAYPLANIMVADEQNFHTDNRRRFVAQAALNDLDAVVLTHSAFGLLRSSEASARKVLDELLSEMYDAMEALTTGTDSKGRPVGDTMQDTSTISQIQARIESIEQKFFGRMDSNRDNVLDFEDLGVDFLYVDEAHEFRKLDFVTNQNNLKGIDPTGSMRALDLLVKSRWLDSQRPGRSMVLASGTPLTNTMAELFSIQRFLGHRDLTDDQLDNFDAWAKQFGEVEENIEPNAAGAYKPVKRFSKFVNTGVMMQRVRKFMDILTLTQLGDLIRVPKVKLNSKGVAGPEVVIGEATKDLHDYLKGELSDRIAASEAWKPSFDQKYNPDPMIAIIGDGQLAAFDMRFIYPELPNDPDSKLNKMIDGIIDSYHKYNDIEYINKDTGEPEPIKGAAHIVFSFVGIGDQVAKNRGFDARKWMRSRMIEAGIPSDEIAFIADYKSSSAKQALFKEVRQGKKKILIGTPKNMGTGVNAQTRLKTLHYGSAPWYPADIEQPHGRIIRQGNQNDEVELYWYATKGTYDETQWGMLARKSKTIEDVMTGQYDGDVEDMSESSQYAMASALASGDPRALRLAELRGQVEKYNRLHQAYHATQQKLERDLSNINSSMGGIPYVEKNLADVNSAIALAPSHVDKENFEITIGKDTYNKDSDKNNAEIGTILRNAWAQAIKDSKKAVLGSGKSVDTDIAKVLGKFPIEVSVSEDMRGLVSRPRIKMADVYVALTDAWIAIDQLSDVSESGLITRIQNAINTLGEKKTRYETELKEKREQKVKIQEALGKPFEYEQALYDARAEMNQLAMDMMGAGLDLPPEGITADELGQLQLIDGSRDLERTPDDNRELDSSEVSALKEAYDLSNMTLKSVLSSPLNEDSAKESERMTIEEMRDQPYRDIENIVDEAEFDLVGGKVRLNIQAHELLRRTQEQNRLETKQKAGKRPDANDVEDLFGGEFLNPAELQRNIEILRAKAKEAKDLGYEPEFVGKLNAAADTLEEASKEGQGTIVAYVLDSALPHELFHQVDYINAVDKSLLNRHTEEYKKPLDAHPVAKILWTKHFSKFNEYTRYTKQEHLNGRLRSEIPPFLLESSDETLAAMGITPEMKADYLRLWMEGYAAKNGVESLDKFAEENLNVETYINEAKTAFQGQSNVGGTGEEGQTVDSGQVSERQGEKPPDEGRHSRVDAGEDLTGGIRLTAETHMGRRIEKRQIEKELGLGDDTRLRSLPLTLRRAGIEALDLAYEVFHDGPAIEAATDLLEKHGMEGSIDLLRNMPAKGLDAEHGILSFMLMRTLQNHAVSVRDSDPETARKHFELSLELGREHAIMATQLGRFTRVPSIVGPSVETLKYAIQGIVEAREGGMSKTLTPEQWEHIEGLGRNLEVALTKIDALRRDKINLQAQNRRLKDEQAGKRRRRTASGQKNRQKLVDLIQEDKERVQGVENARTRLRAKFNTDAAEVSESDSTSQKSVLPSDDATSTKAFKKWFKDSKVVDDNGNPLVVYHSTDYEGDIDKFETDVVYFSARKDFSREFGNHTFEAYLSLQNPYDFNKTDGVYIKENGRKPKIEGDYVSIGWLDAAPDIVEDMQRRGFDGAIDGDMEFIVAFRPEQIKSAIGNNGNFDENEPSILKSVLPDEGLDADTLKDFSEVGAMMLTEGLAGEEDYLPSDFKAEMISEFGTSIEPYFDEIYKAAWDKRTEWLNDTRAKETKERIENKYNQGQELEDWQIAEIVGEEKANAKRRRFIERYHEITAGGTKKPRNLDAYKAIIADLTQDLDDTVTLGALVHAEGLGIAAIHKRLTAFGITEDSEQRRALREGSKIFEQAKKIHRSQQEEIANEILRNDGNLKQIDELMWEARNQLKNSQRAIKEEMQRIKNGEGWYRLSQLANALNASRTMMASFDMSGALRQGGFFTFAKPEMQKKAFVNMWNSIREKGYGAAIMELEKMANFTLSQRAGIDYAVAGKTDEGSLMGEELFKGEKTIEHLPVVGKLVAEGVVKWSERTYTAFLDTQRAVMFDVFAKDLMSQGLTFRDNPAEFKKIADFINIATGRGVMPSNKYAKLLMDLPLFAPRYTLSRLQLLNMTLNPVAYYNMPPAARKIIAGQAVRFYGTTMGILGLVTAFGAAVGASVNWDDDDSDFLKIKIGNTYYDIFAGNLQAAKLIIKIVHSAIRTKGGFENRLHGEFGWDVLQALGRFGRGKLSPGASLITDWALEKDYIGNDFTWTKGIATRLMPLTLADMYEAWKLDGVVGIAKSTPFTFLGVGVANYKQRPEIPNTEAEKFAAKAAAWSFKGVSKLDRQQKELKDSLVWRSRMGEDVSAEVDAAVKAGIFSPNHKREILSAAKKTYLQDKAEGLGLDDMETVLKVATASERQELLPLVSEKMKNADVDGKLSPAQRGRLEKYGASVLGDFPMPDAVRDEFDMLNMKTPDVGESLTVKKGEKRELSTGQYDKYRRETLERVYKEVEELLQKPSYQQGDAEEKRRQLKKAIAKGRRAEQKDTKREMRRELVP